MDERVARLDTHEECEQFAKNVESRLPELALAARRRAVELCAGAYGAESAVEREAIEAVYAYEAGKSKLRGRNVRATRTWQMIKRHGIIPAIEKVVSRPDAADGYKVLVEMNMTDFAFEAVVCRNSDAFSAEALARSQKRMREWEDAGGS